MAMIDTSPERRKGAAWKTAEWVLGLAGAIATFTGGFVLFGPADEYVGLGGDWSWRVGDISSAWTSGLILGGLVLLGLCLAMVVAGRRRVDVGSTPFTDLMVHIGVFAIVNAFVWAQDFALGDGLNYALWMTIPWGIGLLTHAYLYWRNRADLTSPVPVEEPRRELLHH